MELEFWMSRLGFAKEAVQAILWIESQLALGKEAMNGWHYMRVKIVREISTAVLQIQFL